MPLAAGQTLSHYRITGPLGAGAMGEVWRALDTRLGREVAVKVLPEHFAADADRLKRFEREARTLAALNHPNVAQIFGLDQVGDTCFLVLELVPGEDLAARLARGALPVEEALDVCRQVAAGLEAAHEAGIVHRDLKPANVRITPEGKVKVLDFGLAKPLPPAATQHGPLSASDRSASDSALLTEAGLVLGTPTYMSPEQARGRPVDRRTDLWAFGCVLFECLTAKRAFGGATAGDVLSAVLQGEPDTSLLPPSTPSRAVELIQRCLEKDPLRRLRDAGDARIELEDALAGRDRAPATARRTRPGLAVRLALTGAALFLAGWVAGRWRTPREPAATAVAPRPFHLSATLSAEARFGGLVAIAPDASFLVYRSSPVEQPDLDSWRDRFTTRWLDRDETRTIDGTEGAIDAALSPDARWLAFLAFPEGRDTGPVDLKKVALEDGRAAGPPVLLCRAIAVWAGLCFASEQQIVLTVNFPEARILEVPVQGGTPRVVVSEPPEAGGPTCGWWRPQPLTAGRVLATRYQDREGKFSQDVEVIDLATGERKLALAGASGARYAPTGHLLAMRDGALVAVPYDAAGLEITGELAAIRGGLSDANWSLPYCFSQSGVLATVSRPGGGHQRKLAWIDPQGRAAPLEGPDLPFTWVAISRDGRRVAYGAWEPDEIRPAAEFWVKDLERRTTVRLARPEFSAVEAVWDPAGERLTFGAGSGRTAAIWECRADGADEPARLYTLQGSNGEGVPLDWTGDGSALAFARWEPGSDEVEIWMLQRGEGGAEGVATRYLTTSTTRMEARFSPDGKWICFDSVDSGRQELYVQRFSGVGSGEEDARAGRWRVSTGGGYAPWWSADGREIRYVDAQDRLVSVSVEAGPSFSVGEARTLLDLKELGMKGPPTFTEDGRMLIVMKGKEGEEVTRIDVVLEWFEELKASAPARGR